MILTPVMTMMNLMQVMDVNNLSGQNAPIRIDLATHDSGRSSMRSNSRDSPIMWPATRYL